MFIGFNREIPNYLVKNPGVALPSDSKIIGRCVYTCEGNYRCVGGLSAKLKILSIKLSIAWKESYHYFLQEIGRCCKQLWNRRLTIDIYRPVAMQKVAELERSRGEVLEFETMVDAEELHYLAQAVRTSQTLQVLRIEGCNQPTGWPERPGRLPHVYLSEDSVTELAEAIEHHASLRVLNFNYCGTTEPGAHRLIDAIAKSTDLQALSFVDKGGIIELPMVSRHFFDMVKRHPNLLSLELFSISDVESLIDALKANSPLTRLYFTRTHARVEREQAIGLARALRENTHLRTFHYNGNLCPELLHELAITMESNQTLTSLHVVQAPQFCYIGADAAREALQVQEEEAVQAKKDRAYILQRLEENKALQRCQTTLVQLCFVKVMRFMPAQ